MNANASVNPGKRRFSEERLDMEWLLSQPQLLSSSEYFHTRIPQPYPQYVAAYYQARIFPVFDSFRAYPWFAAAYAAEDTRRGSTAGTDSAALYIVVESVEHTLTLPDLLEKYNTQAGVLGFAFERGYRPSEYKRDLYVSISPSADTEQLLSGLSCLGRTRLLDIQGLSIEEGAENCRLSLTEALELLTAVCALNSTDISAVTDTQPDRLTVRDCVRILRSHFRFCTHCVRQYDTHPAMVAECSASHGREAPSVRNIRILCGYSRPMGGRIRDIEYGRPGDMYTRMGGSVLSCNECRKQFESYEYMAQHIRTRHAEVTGQSQSPRECFGRFLAGIDFYFLNIINGTEGHTPAWYDGPRASSAAVLYDMPCIFSGEIAITRPVE